MDTAGLRTALRVSRLSLLALLAGAGGVRADDATAFQPLYKPTLQVRPAQGEIRIDGDLDDPGWVAAARAVGFAEIQPGDQVRPPVESEAWVAFDEKNFYLALLARDDPNAIRVSLRERDAIWNDDYFGLMLDTYGDHSWGYEFFVNPIGIQGDLRIYSGGEEDISYDLIWFSEGRVTADGYQVEIAIPFASLRFPEREEQAWRVNFWRDHQRDIRRQYAWAATNRDDPCWMCQWGTLTGIRGIRPPRNLEIIPSAIGTLAGARRELDPGRADFEYDDPEGEAAVNFRYALTSTVSTELTINPDFSQIESDAGQIDINEPFTLFYDEKRPFFLEGSELYRSYLSAIYTRSISDPTAAGKLLASHGRTSFAWTIGRDEHAPVILPTEERSFFVSAGESVTNLFRVRHAFGTDSHIGGLVTDRRLSGEGSNTVGGIDGSVRLLRNFQLRAQLLGSRTVEPDDSTLAPWLDGMRFDQGRHTLGFDGEEYDGRAVYAALDRSGRIWNGSLAYEGWSPTFRADNGFVTRNDYHSLNLWNGFEFIPNGATIVNWMPALSIGRLWDDEGRFQDEWIVGELGGVLKGQTELEIEGLLSRERFREKLIPGIRRVSLHASSRPTERIGVGLAATLGRSIYRSFDPELEPFLGKIASIYGETSLKLLQRLSLETSLDYARMKTPDGESLVYDGWILRHRLDLQLNREGAVRLVVEYDKFDHRFAFEPLLTYRLNAFSVLYLGIADQYDRLTENDGVAEQPEERLRLRSRQVFGKIQYLFRV